jgi:thioredoxin 1
VERVGVEAFEGEGLRRPGTVAVAFLADWCPFCRVFAPEFERLAEDGGPATLVADVTDEASPLWDRFRIEVVPTVVVFHDGQAIFRADGVPGQGLGAEALAAIRSAASAAGPRRRRTRRSSA